MKNPLLTTAYFVFGESKSFLRARHAVACLVATLSVGMLSLSLAMGQPMAQDDYFLNSQLGLSDSFGTTQETVELEAEFKLKPGTRLGMLNVTATVIDDWHIFSITQVPGGPIRSKISVAESEQYKLKGRFVALDEPHGEMSDIYKIIVEEHEGIVTWAAPIEIAEGVNPEDLKIKVVFNGQACESRPNGRCVLVSDVAADASFDGFDEKLKLPEAPKKQELKLVPFAPQQLHATVVGKVEKVGDGMIQAGDKLKLEITAKALDDYHVYAYGTPDKKYAFIPSMVIFEDPKAWRAIGPKASEEPELDDKSFGPDQPVLFHHEVTWSFELVVPKKAKPEEIKKLTGGLLLQTCNESGCDPPLDIQFVVDIPVGTGSAAALQFSLSDDSIEETAKKGKTAAPDEATLKKWLKEESERPPTADSPSTEPDKAGAPDSAKPEKAAEVVIAADSPEQISAMAALYKPDEKIKYLRFTEMADSPIGSGKTSSASDTSLGLAFLLMFAGGIVLNLMPCVFPVLGIKVMGFVKLGGEDNAKVRAHGLMFGLGLIVSMWVLAGAVLIVKVATEGAVQWGAQMGNPYFVGIMIVFLFLFGLNMAGIFEIGTSLSSVGGKATQGDGYLTSFISGVLTTLIATPCSGPFLGSAMGVALADDTSTLTTMSLFTIFGLGIAMPYVVLSFFPEMIKKLPKPGPWMETFKVIMSFALFATCAFFMRTFGDLTGSKGLSLLVMAMVVFGLAAYLFGSFGEPHIKSGRRIPFGYLFPLLLAGLASWMTFTSAYTAAEMVEKIEDKVVAEGEVHWTNWRPGKVEYLLASRKSIIWVDYTANW